MKQKNTQELRKDLKNGTEEILSSGEDFWVLNEGLQKLHNVFGQLTGIYRESLDLNDPAMGDGTLLKEGKAVGPGMAVHCFFDPTRTQKLLLGICDAIREAQRRFPGERLHILYAGTGPYAPLAVPLTTLFSPEEISFTLLDIHETSINAIKKIVDGLEIQNYISEIVLGNAITYRHQEESPFHLVVTETMHAALHKEPQVSISMNIVKQLKKDGILIPENIRVSACLFDNKVFMERINSGGSENVLMEEIGDLINFNLQMAKEFGEKDDVKDFPPLRLLVPEIVGSRKWLRYATEVTVFGKEVIKPNQSIFTIMMDVVKDSPMTGGEEYEFSYQIDKNPGFVATRIS